jgi:hypothetical protein
MLALAASVAFVVPTPASAETFRCEANGDVTYTDHPCGSGSRQTRVGPPALEADAKATVEARDRYIDDTRRANEAVEAARQRNDADARLRAEVAMSERNAQASEARRVVVDDPYQYDDGFFYGGRGGVYRPRRPYIPDRSSGSTGQQPRTTSRTASPGAYRGVGGTATATP